MVRRRLVATLALLLPLAVAACGTAVGTTGTIQGQLIGGGAPPGGNNPLAGTVVAYAGQNASGTVAARATPGPDGSYSLQLPPGTYYVTGSPSVAGRKCEGYQVEVLRGLVKIVEVLCG
jgi:hypothetical protein